MAVEMIGESAKDTNFLLFVAWLNRQLKHDFSRSFDAKGGCRFERLEVDDLHRHLAGFISDELITVSGWLRPLEGDAIRTAPLLRFWATSIREDRVALRLECIEPTLSAYCKELLERINIQFARDSEPLASQKQEGATALTQKETISKFGIPDTRRKKILAYQEWQDSHGEFANFDDWSEARFGTHPDGSLKVPRSTLSGWKRYIENSSKTRK